MELKITGFVALPFSLIRAMGSGEVLVNDLTLSVFLDIDVGAATLNGFSFLSVYKVHRPAESKNSRVTI